jgi:demethylmenaquinone methyltransferase/2-methoxy-6-polyprenyl-1,4-benzoquinol methylase
MSDLQSLARPDSKTIQSLFNAIPAQYDFLNSFLSMGLDRYWRAVCAAKGLDGTERSILDLGVGTGKSLQAFLGRHHFKRAVGCDFSDQMLMRARARLPRSAELVACDFHDLPFPDRTFDIVTGSFMLRSVQQMDRFLAEVRRVLAPSGKTVFCELTRPTSYFVRAFLFEPYLRFYVPQAGKLFSKHDHAYRFLTESILAFPSPEELKKMFQSAGFSDLSVIPLTMGIATLLIGRVNA